MSNINWGQIISNFASAMNNNVSSFASKNANILGAGWGRWDSEQRSLMRQL